MKRALCELSGRIAQIASLGQDFPVASPLVWRDCADDVTMNYTWDGAAFVAPPAATLAESKAKRKKAVDALLATKIAAGRSYGGSVYQIRSSDLINITGIRVALLAGIANAHGGIWRNADNINVTMDDTAFATFAANVMAYVRDLIRKSSTHKDAIDALADIPTVDAYDITADWPANP